MIYFFLIMALFIAIAICLIVVREPIDLICYVNRFLDSYEKVDYEKEGKVKQDYLRWESSEYIILVNYHLQYRWEGYLFKRKNEISVKLENLELPDGFQMSMKESSSDFHEYHSDHEMLLADKFEFLVKIDQLDNYIDLSEPKLIKFDINVIVTGTKIRKTISYNFLIGENLGDLWVAFDPGTTATTIAFGNENTEISVAKNIKNEILTPSVLVFDRENTNFSFYGDDAVRRIRSTRQYIGFRSIKKMLGFRDTNGVVRKNGQELATKLLGDIYEDVKKTNLSIQKAKRAIVAIPNNYTANKIKEMLSCVEDLKQFKEIRTIYEAESILFYYLSNKSALEQSFSCVNTKYPEIILVFDMGGATMNITVAQSLKQNDDIYIVNILSKIGYGIGGDSIDYCILKSIFEFDKQLDIEHINILNNKYIEDFDGVKEKLIQLSFKIKQQIIKNGNKTELISANELQIYLKEAAEKDIYVDIESDFYRIFRRKSKFCILWNNYFENLIFGSIRDAMSEVLKIARNPKIDKIILAGRSSSFPEISSTIINSFAYSPDVINLDEIGMAKTAVSEGACWYGINSNCIELNNLKTSANFGFVKTKSLDRNDVQFINLIGIGTEFTNEIPGKIKSVQKIVDFKDRFNFDGNKINFYQVMGYDCDDIFIKNQKHKYSKIGGVKLLHESESVGIKVNESDDINYSVKLISGKIEKHIGVVCDQEISDANDEHYTWVVN